MDYKNVELSNYNLVLEIGFLPVSVLGSFLNQAQVNNGAISKQEWEAFLITKLVASREPLDKVLDGLPSDRDKVLCQHDVVTAIYKVNPRLYPKNIIVLSNTLVHVSDAVRQGIKSQINLISNPGWVSSVDANSWVDTKSISDFCEKLFDEVKYHYPDRNYVMEPVSLLGFSVPVMDLTSIGWVASDVVEEFINRRCEGDVSVARNNPRGWNAQVISLTLPKADDIAYMLSQGGFMSLYTENMIMVQLYLAVVSVNPSLDWDQIDWDSFEDPESKASVDLTKEKEAQNKRRLPLIKVSKGHHKSGHRAASDLVKRRSSKAELESEQHRFTDVTGSDLASLRDRLKAKVVGQDEAIDALVNAISVARVGLKGPKRPVGSFLFAGITGIGKTELAKVLADELTFGQLARVDCSEYQEKHEIAKIFGAPPGYVGFEDYGKGMDSDPPRTLAIKLKDQPFSVVLFDELEKAHESLSHSLLQIMDEGHVTSGRGEVVSFNEAIVIMTSNVGTKEAAEACSRNDIGFTQQVRDNEKLESVVISKEIKNRFNPEFLNRLTAVIQFKKLSKQTCEAIAGVLLQKTKTNLEEAQKMSLAWGDDVCKFIVERGFSEDYGARNLRRTIELEIELPLANYILENRYLVDQLDDPTKAKKIGFVPHLARPTDIRLWIEEDQLRFSGELANEKTIVTKNGSTDPETPDVGKPRRKSKSNA